ncbi:MAG TPA: hypothetical protein VGR00_00870, partial [Thermoanaerobaculia bacterium]|nr:hypothetical protein [Thermoanaerobaculia bacterium]
MLKKLTISQKLLTIGLVFLVPMAFLVFLLFKELHEKIQFTAYEKLGDEYQRPLERLLEHIPQHAFAERRALLGSEKARADALQKATLIDADFKSLREVDHKLSEPLQ